MLGRKSRLRKSCFLCGALLAVLAQDADAAVKPPDEGTAERVETQCKLLAQERNLSGKALNKSVKSCLTQEAPDLGVWETCRSRGRDKGYTGTVLRSFVGQCLNEAQ